jgi:5'-nucleotidase
MTRFLIVNDDGVTSPMLPPMVKHLGSLGTVSVAVPLREQSWKSKAMTRYEPITYEARAEFGVEAYAIDGTPSDCVNIAVHHLLAERPDWVISGINIGVNAGEAYVINSGTVGAAFEGGLLGLPAVAFSQYVPPAIFHEWTSEKRLTSPAAAALIEHGATRVARMMRTIVAEGLPPGAMLLNVNFPDGLAADTPVQWCNLLVTRYGSIFDREGDHFIHRFGGNVTREPHPLGDKDVVEQGKISVTALSLPGLAVPVDGYPIP